MNTNIFCHGGTERTEKIPTIRRTTIEPRILDAKRGYAAKPQPRELEATSHRRFEHQSDPKAVRSSIVEPKRKRRRTIGFEHQLRQLQRRKSSPGIWTEDNEVNKGS